MTKDKGSDKTKVSMELMHELLKQIQGSLSSVEKSIEEIRREQISQKAATHDLRGYMIKIEGDLAELQIDVNRIKKRLNLVEA